MTAETHRYISRIKKDREINIESTYQWNIRKIIKYQIKRIPH